MFIDIYTPISANIWVFAFHDERKSNLFHFFAQYLLSYNNKIFKFHVQITKI